MEVSKNKVFELWNVSAKEEVEEEYINNVKHTKTKNVFEKVSKIKNVPMMKEHADNFNMQSVNTGKRFYKIEQEEVKKGRPKKGQTTPESRTANHQG